MLRITNQVAERCSLHKIIKFACLLHAQLPGIHLTHKSLVGCARGDFSLQLLSSCCLLLQRLFNLCQSILTQTSLPPLQQ